MLASAFLVRTAAEGRYASPAAERSSKWLRLALTRRYGYVVVIQNLRVIRMTRLARSSSSSWPASRPHA